MGRPPRFTEDQMLDAGLALLVEGGTAALTLAAIAKRIGAPSGSIYHRFASRDLLVGHLWVRTIQAFQDGYLAALAGEMVSGEEVPGEDAAGELASAELVAGVRRAAAHVLTWSRDHPGEVALILLHRSEDLLGDEWPEELRARNQAQRARVTAAVRELAARLGDDSPATVRRLVFACVEIPTAEVRHCLARGTLPDATSLQLVDEAVVALLDPVLQQRRSS